MSAAQSLGSYADIYTAFSTTLRRGFVSLEFPTHSSAVRFRHRAYSYRNLLRKKQQHLLGDPHAIVSTDFDELVLRIKDNPSKKAPFFVEIEKVRLAVAMRDAEGNIIDPEKGDDPSTVKPGSATGAPDDELEEAAKLIAAKLKKSFLG